MRDMIDWRWLTADDFITLGYIDTDGEAGEVELERCEGEDWGFEFFRRGVRRREAVP